MQAIFSEDWTYTTGEILAGDHFYPQIPNGGSILGQAIKASRGDSTSLAKMLYYVAIQSAKASIHIANAYFLPDKQVREALVNAVKRGVDVQVMVPGHNIDLPMVRFASWLHYGELLRGGVKIFEYRPTMMHNKTMVVDGLYSTIGSINFDSRSMNRNAEESLAFYEREFSGRMEAMFQEDKKRCEEITLELWEHRGLPKRLAEMVFWVWEPYY
jgi:cardiolipin synthase